MWENDKKTNAKESTHEKKPNTPLKTMRFCGGNKNRNFRAGKEIFTCQPLVISTWQLVKTMMELCFNEILSSGFF